jgi:hypothetical protein
MLTWVIPQKKKKLAKQRGSQPNASISQSCEDSASTKAAYRFYENMAFQLGSYIKRIFPQTKPHHCVKLFVG